MPRPLLALLSLTLLLTAGCGVIADKVGTREVVVVFVDDVTPTDVARVRASCDGFPRVVQMPPATNETAANRRYPLRYDVTTADDADLNRLATCLAEDDSVRTFLSSGGGLN